MGQSGEEVDSSGQIMANTSQSLLTAASLASILGMQLNTLTSPPAATSSQATMTTGNRTSLTAAQTMMVGKL